jgi:uncharacterized protein involved in response to NO
MGYTGFRRSSEAYRLFFPLGIAMGIAGVAIWPLYFWDITSGYSGSAHAFVQSDCFLYAFVAGFLWTAVPQFAGTSAPSRPVQYGVAAMLAVATVAFELEYFLIGHCLFLAAHTSVIAVVARRLRHCRSALPDTAPLIGLALLAGLAGAVTNAGIAAGIIAPAIYLVGRRLLTEGMMLLLVLGVGGFLGSENLERRATVRRDRRMPYTVMGLLIVLSIVLQYGWNIEAAAWLRALIATLVVLINFRPGRRPEAKTTASWCLWIAYWLLIAAVWLIAILPKYRVDFLHVLFIGTFSLLIAALGMRTVLSHGGYGLAAERKSWLLRIVLTTILIAMIARVGAPFVPSVYFLHLGWAGVLWIAGMTIWGGSIVRRIVKVS